MARKPHALKVREARKRLEAQMEGRAVTEGEPQLEKQPEQRIAEALERIAETQERILQIQERIATAQERISASTRSPGPTVIFSEPPAKSPYGEILPEDSPPQQRPVVRRTRDIELVDPDPGSRADDPARPPQ